MVIQSIYPGIPKNLHTSILVRGTHGSPVLLLLGINRLEFKGKKSLSGVCLEMQYLSSRASFQSMGLKGSNRTALNLPIDHSLILLY